MSNTSLREMVIRVIDGNRYMTIGTTESDGSARVSPVYVSHDRYNDFYWVSSPDATHSRNLRARPQVSAVIFDSTAAVTSTAAVYLSGRAEEIAEAELAVACERAFLHLSGGAQAFTPDDLRGATPLRLYRLRADRHAVHIRGRDPVFGRGVDTRQVVTIGDL